MRVLVLGPAGVGKSSLVPLLAKALGAAKINADPAVRYIPYKPDFDIRSRLKVEEIMEKYKLGPNAAILKAMELLPSMLEVPSDSVIDMPGQIDALILSRAGETIASRFGDIGVFLIDGSRDVDSIYSQLLLYLATQLKLSIPVVYVFSKSDLYDEEKIEKILEGKILPTGNLAEIFERVKISTLLPPQRTVFISVKKKDISDLVELLEEVYCTCGDLT